MTARIASIKNAGQGKTNPAKSEGVKYPSMAHLFQGPIDVHSALLPAHFANPACKLVIGVILHDGKDVYLIEPKRAPAGSNVHVFLQEKAVYLKDCSFGAVALRGLDEEIGLSPKDVVLHPECLSWFDNQIPLIRTNGVATTKCIVYAVARIKKTAKLRLNQNEVRHMVFATSSDSYFNLTGDIERFRPQKWIGQTDALTAVVAADLLSGPDWDDFRRLAGTPTIH